jgi:hypothetical protein
VHVRVTEKTGEGFCLKLSVDIQVPEMLGRDDVRGVLIASMRTVLQC